MPTSYRQPSRASPFLKARAPRILAGLVVAALAAAALVFGGQGLVELASALSDHQRVIVSEPWAGAAVLLGLVGLSLAAVLVLARPADPARRRSRRRGGRRRTAAAWIRIYLALALAGVVASLFMPLIQGAAVESVIAPYGYAPCPPVPSPRRQPDRWARPADICPVTDPMAPS